MKVNVDWLKDYVEIKEDTQTLADALTMAGLEVEGIEDIDGETVLEIGVTPNRPDWLCHVGVAREIAAIYDRTLKLPEVNLEENGPDVQALTSIDIEDPEGCPRYSGRVLMDVSSGQAPEKIKKRLESIGVRSISSIVDATNYVMMELGHPTHAFDLDQVAGQQLTIHRAGSGDTLTTLDGVERALDPGDIVISDAEGIVSLAGVMGYEP